MSRKTCVINHRLPSFRFRLERARLELGGSAVATLNKESAYKSVIKGGYEVSESLNKFGPERPKMRGIWRGRIRGKEMFGENGKTSELQYK